MFWLLSLFAVGASAQCDTTPTPHPEHSGKNSAKESLITLLVITAMVLSVPVAHWWWSRQAALTQARDDARFARLQHAPEIAAVGADHDADDDSDCVSDHLQAIVIAIDEHEV